MKLQFTIIFLTLFACWGAHAEPDAPQPPMKPAFSCWHAMFQIANPATGVQALAATGKVLGINWVLRKTIYDPLAAGAKKLREYLVDYYKEFKETRGLRVIIKKKPANALEKRLFGFLVEYRPEEASWMSLGLGHLSNKWKKMTAIERDGKLFRFSLMGGINHTLGTPIRYGTRRLLGEERVLSRLFTLPLGFLAFSYFYNKADEADKEALGEQVIKDIEADPGPWDDRIDNDFRFADLRKARQEGKISAKDARVKAYARYHEIKNYFLYMTEAYDHDTPEGRDEFMKAHPLFGALVRMKEKGIPKEDGLRYPPGFSHRLEDGQYKRLQDIQHGLQFTMELIPMLVKQPPELKDWEASERGKKLKELIMNDPYTEALFDFRKRGIMDDNELILRLQQDAFHKAYFKSLDILKIEKMKKGADGKFGNEPESIEDRRDAAIDEIGNSHNQRRAGQK